jgi:class 3 adenylate cyclase
MIRANTMEPEAPTGWSAEELGSAAGESPERVRRFRALGLIGSEDDDRFAPEDLERVRLIQFLERRGIELEAIARAEREEAVLGSVVEFLYADGVGRTVSVARAAEIVGLGVESVRRLREASGSTDDVVSERDLQMLEGAKTALDAGFPERALLQLLRVYSDALGRVAEAEARLFHFYVHEGLRAEGLSGAALLDRARSARERLLPLLEPLIRYFHWKGMAKAVRDDMVLHATRDAARPDANDRAAELRLAIVFLDLSSYTPMTEVMGDAVAARLVERFSEIVREATARCDGRVVDRVGDAFLLVFPDPRAAVACALEVERSAAAEPRFPAMRGAVHWGDVLYQEGGYVGSSLNIASRLATQAAPHQILVTGAARGEIGALAGVAFVPLGNRRLKGLAEEPEVFEARANVPEAAERFRDPVCGIEMAPAEIGARLSVKGREVAFCCEKCLRTFVETPRKYETSPA